MQLSITLSACTSALPTHVHTCRSSYRNLACAPDASESTYEIGHVAVEDMHLYILCRCVVLPEAQLRDITVSKKGYSMDYIYNTAHVTIEN